MYKIDKETKKQIIELMTRTLKVSERIATLIFDCLDEIAIKDLITKIKPSIKQEAFYFSYNGEDQTTFCYATPLNPNGSLLEEQTIIYLN